MSFTKENSIKIMYKAWKMCFLFLFFQNRNDCFSKKRIEMIEIYLSKCLFSTFCISLVLGILSVIKIVDEEVPHWEKKVDKLKAMWMDKTHKLIALKFWVKMWCKTHLCSYLLNPWKNITMHERKSLGICASSSPNKWHQSHDLTATSTKVPHCQEVDKLKGI